jgi:glutathione S-transferase
MLKLYGGPRSRATIIQWYLAELDLEHEFVMLDMQAGEHRQLEFLAINPMGKVPAIVDGDFKLWESGAILLYLQEKYGSPLTLEERALCNQWILFANATLGPGIFVEANREREMPKLIPALSQILEQQPYLLGENLTVADIAVGSMVFYMGLMLKLDLSPYPGVISYVQHLSQRPAFQAVFGTGS